MKKNKDFPNEIMIEGSYEEVPPAKVKKKVLTITLITVIAVAVIAVSVAVYAGLHAYQKPFKNVVKGVNKADTLLLMEAIYPEDMITVKRINKKESGTAWKDYLKQNDDYIEKRMDDMGLKKAKYEIVAKEKISGSNFDDIENFYEDKYEADVKKAYRVEVNMTFKTRGGDETPSGWICVVKLKDDGWKFCPEYSDSHFDFIDNAISFQ